MSAMVGAMVVEPRIARPEDVDGSNGGSVDALPACFEPAPAGFVEGTGAR